MACFHLVFASSDLDIHFYLRENDSRNRLGKFGNGAFQRWITFSPSHRVPRAEAAHFILCRSFLSCTFSSSSLCCEASRHRIFFRSDILQNAPEFSFKSPFGFSRKTIPRNPTKSTPPNKVRRKVLTLAHLTVGQTLKSNRLEPICGFWSCRKIEN